MPALHHVYQDTSSLARALWLLLASLALAACAQAPAASPAAPLPANIATAGRALGSGPGGPVLAGDTAPDFEYRTADGAVHRLSDLRGKVVVVNFWATWCGPCRQEMPDLQRVADGEQAVVLGVNKLEAPEAIGPYAGEVGVRFTLVADRSGDIPERYGVRNLPTSFFIRPDGTVSDWRLGAMDEQTIREGIRKAGQASQGG